MFTQFCIISGYCFCFPKSLVSEIVFTLSCTVNSDFCDSGSCSNLGLLSFMDVGSEENRVVLENGLRLSVVM